MIERYHIELPQNVSKVLNTLKANGYEAYIVGGCVRDALLKKTPGDWDITTSAPPLEVKKLFRRSVDTGIQHGTVTVMLGDDAYEVTTYRIDGDYADSRHPKEVIFTASLEEDLKRRDFTINAMAYDEEEGIKDLFGGTDDLEAGIIRCVGDPKERFSEDSLRVMRALRFAAQLGFDIEKDTVAAMKEMSGNLSKISAERIQTELVKTLVSDNPGKLTLGREYGITAAFLPEYDRCFETPQNNPHHCYSVGEHIMKSIESSPKDRTLRLTMLLHDMAKPLCRTTDEKGIDHFYSHVQKGAELSKDILRRLKFDNRTISSVYTLIRYHDFWPERSGKGIRGLLRILGPELFEGFLKVKKADISAQSDYKRDEKLEYLLAVEEIYRDVMAKGHCYSIKGLRINGSDVMEAGVPAGKAVGDTLDKLLDAVIEDPALNDREKLLSMVKTIARKYT